jgi:hypothetical protein
MFPYSYYAPSNIYYTPRRVERPDPAEDLNWNLERVAALRAAELERKEQQKAELKQQYEQRLAQIDEHHRQQELELKRYEEHIKKLQEQKRLQEQRLLEQQKQKAEARKRNEKLINSLFNNYESRQKPSDSETSARTESKLPSSPFELLLSLLNGTDLDGSPAKTPADESTPHPATSNVIKNEKKPAVQDSEKTALVVKPETALNISTRTPAVSKDAPVPETTEAAPLSETKEEPEVNLKEALQSISEEIDKNIETYDRIHTNTIDGNQEDGELCSSLSTASDTQPSSITLRSRLKVLQRSQLELENIYQQLDNLGTPKDKIEKRLKHVLTGRAVSYADKVEELRHRIQKDLAAVQKEEKHKAAESTPAESEPVEKFETAPSEEKPLNTATNEPAKVEESNSTPVCSEEEIKKSPKPAPKPEQKEKSRVRRIEIQDLSDDEDL